MDKPPRDLLARSLRFADEIIDFVEREQQRRRIAGRILDQLQRAGTSVGAHNAEAESAITRRHLLALRARALQEAEESQYWLMVIQRRRTAYSETVVASLLAQVSELVAILKVCVRKLRGQ
jgi:four helix bundle protein